MTETSREAWQDPRASLHATGAALTARDEKAPAHKYEGVGSSEESHALPARAWAADGGAVTARPSRDSEPESAGTAVGTPLCSRPLF